MQDSQKRQSSSGNRREIEGLPVIRRRIAGIDIGSERHWVCAPTIEESGREVADFGATTPELIRMPRPTKGDINRLVSEV